MKRSTKQIVILLFCAGSVSAAAQNLGWVAIGPFEGSSKAIRQLSVKLDNKMTLYAVTGIGILSYWGNAHWKTEFPNTDDPYCRGSGELYNGIWFSPHIDSLSFVAYHGCNIDPTPTLERLYGTRDSRIVYGAAGVGASFNLVFDPLSDSVLYVDIVGLRISRDAGLTWFPDDYHSRDFYSYLFMRIDEATGSKIYAHGNNAVYVTADTGHTKKSIFDFNNERYVSDLLAWNDTLVIAVGRYQSNFTADYGILWSSDGGATWTQALRNQNMGVLCRDPLHPLSLYASGEKGIYSSGDGGQTWSLYNNTLPSLTITDLAKDPFSDTLYVGTSNAGVYRVYESVVGVEDIPSFLQTRFRLYQNHPNPFNPSTTITYDLPARSHVTLKVFNVLGEEIATLVNGNVEAGWHQVQWNADRLSSGVYFYRLQAGKFVENRKMILLR
jgi:hypothetical protein